MEIQTAMPITLLTMTTFTFKVAPQWNVDSDFCDIEIVHISDFELEAFMKELYWLNGMEELEQDTWEEIEEDYPTLSKHLRFPTIEGKYATYSLMNMFRVDEMMKCQPLHVEGLQQEHPLFDERRVG